MLELIKTAAIDEMIGHGLKFTMGDLAARLSISKKTLYDYFPSKEALVGAIIDSELNERNQTIKDVINDQKLNFYQKYKSIQTVQPKWLRKLGVTTERQLIEDFKRYMPELWNKVKQSKEQEWNVIEEFLKEGIAKGYIRPVNLKIIQKIMNEMDEMLDERFLAESNLSIVDCVTQITEIVMVGIVNPSRVIDAVKL
jgi:AcrR family transcriptional regulator